MQQNIIKQSLHKHCRKVIEECFWEYKITEDEFLILAKEGSEQEKYFLFAKILENATDVLKSLSVFSLADQQKLLRRYTLPKFNRFFSNGDITY